ncbi:acetylajmalan esterase-like [Cornus florida]|uniref:acetylajmalan esterase-like n=1 Tax=Cornus florida TaxID=4283 RepID=UPI002896B63B|nr:acetylajmalan esterase-like [Cornus florida]
MAINTNRLLFCVFVSTLMSSIFLLLVPQSCHAQMQYFVRPLMNNCRFDAIYQLGDSISDTGNLIRETPIGAALPLARLPYGQTHFNYATGRCSNGLLIIDYLALTSGFSLLDPYKNIDGDFRHGVNFAVAGSTALPTQILAAKNISSPVTSSSLNVQLDWMSTYFNSTCHDNTECVKKLKSSLFMVGEIGGNDYNYALFQGKSIEEVKTIVPNVVHAIKDAVKRVIHYGAVRIVVPGNFPIGCFPIYLTRFKTNDSTAYDEHHCLKALNDFSTYHNDHLQKAIEELKQEYPNAIIAYGDYFNIFIWLFQNTEYLGFNATNVLKACCGTGGDYNFDPTRMCGAPDVPVCADPETFISWDGVHMTQRAYKIMAGKLIRDMLLQLRCVTTRAANEPTARARLGLVR